MALAGSTVTEMGLIGAVVLVATLGMWLLLGDGLKQAFGLVNSDMLAQVSNAKTNAMPVAPSGPPDEQPPPILGDPVIDPADPGPTVVTVGSNGIEGHEETYKALQTLIDRSMKKGTLTGAQAELLSKLIDQILLFNDLFDVFLNAYIDCDYEYCDFDFLSTKKAEFRGETYLLTDLMKRMGKSLTASEMPELEGPYTFYDSDALYENSETAAVEKLFAEAETKGVLDDPEVLDFVMQVKSGLL